MAHVRIHDDDKVAGRVLHPVDVGSAQSQFRWPRLQNDPLLAVDLLQILGHVQSAIGTTIVNHNDLVVDFAAINWFLYVFFTMVHLLPRLIANSPFVHVLDNEPHDNRQVLALIVGGQQDRILVHHGEETDQMGGILGETQNQNKPARTPTHSIQGRIWNWYIVRPPRAEIIITTVGHALIGQKSHSSSGQDLLECPAASCYSNQFPVNFPIPCASAQPRETHSMWNVDQMFS